MQYPVNNRIPVTLIENILWLKRMDFLEGQHHNVLLDVLEKDGREKLSKRMGMRPWDTSELLAMTNKWVLASNGEMYRVLNVIRDADPDTNRLVMLLDQDPVVAYIFDNCGHCPEIQLLTVFDEMPESTSDRLLREQRDHASVDATVARKRYNDIQRSTALPQAMAAPYENELQPKLTTFDDDPHANTYPDLGRDLQRMAEQDDEDDDE